jgi:hypothetical protein
MSRNVIAKSRYFVARYRQVGARWRKDLSRSRKVGIKSAHCVAIWSKLVMKPLKLGASLGDGVTRRSYVEATSSGFVANIGRMLQCGSIL